MDYTDQDYAQAADTCDRFAVALQGMIAAAGILRGMGSLKGQVKTLTKQIGELSKERTDEEAKLQQTKLVAKATTEQLNDARATAAVEARTVLERAKAEAAKLLTEAQDQAARELHHERASRELTLTGLNQQIADARKTLKDLEAKTVKANEAAASVEARAAEAQAKLDKVFASAKSITA